MTPQEIKLLGIIHQRVESGKDISEEVSELLRVRRILEDAKDTARTTKKATA